MWPLIRQRPFSKIPAIDSSPKSIFISMKPTDPLALDQLSILEHNSVGFVEGIDAISNLTEGNINIILDTYSPNTEEIWASDINGDNNINIQDIILLIQFILNL